MTEVDVTTRPFEARWLSFHKLLTEHYYTLCKTNEPRQAAAAALEMAAIILQPEITIHVNHQ